MSKGLQYMLASAAWYAVMSACVKVAGKGLPSSEIVLARVIVTLVLSYAAVRKEGLSPWGNNKGGLVLRGLLGFAGLYCYYYAVTKLPLADAAVIHYINPILAAVFGALLLKEPAGWWTLIGTLVSFLGVIFMARPGGAALDPWGVAAAVTSACTSAAAYLTIRAMRASDHPYVVVFYFPLVSLPLALALSWHELVMPSGWQWFWLLATGVSTQLAQISITKGLHLERAGKATAMSYVQIVFATVVGMMFFGEIPTIATAIGAACVFAGMLLSARA